MRQRMEADVVSLKEEQFYIFQDRGAARRKEDSKLQE